MTSGMSKIMINERQQKPEMAMADGAKTWQGSGVGAGTEAGVSDGGGDMAVTQGTHIKIKHALRVCVCVMSGKSNGNEDTATREGEAGKQTFEL